jgi:hypothetical protein
VTRAPGTPWMQRRVPVSDDARSSGPTGRVKDQRRLSGIAPGCDPGGAGSIPVGRPRFTLPVIDSFPCVSEARVPGSIPGGSTLSRISLEWEAVCKTVVAGSTPERGSKFGGGAHAMDAPRGAPAGRPGGRSNQRLSRRGPSRWRMSRVDSPAACYHDFCVCLVA